MDKGLITQLQILKLSNIKPNFSELARLYDLDRRTVKRYYDGYEGKPKHHNKSSRLDEHYDLIKTKHSLRGANVSAVYEYIKDEVDSSIGTYSNFNKYVKSKGLKPKKTEKGHPCYETDTGVQAQVDWKEDVTLHNRYGEPFTLACEKISVNQSADDIQEALKDLLSGTMFVGTLRPYQKKIHNGWDSQQM